MRAALMSAALSSSPSGFAVNGTEPVRLWDFAQQRFPAGFSHSRGSTGLAIAPDGDWELAPHDTLRFDQSRAVREVILEAGASNLLTHSAAAVSGGWHPSGGSAQDLSLGALGVFDGCRIASNGATWHRLLHSARPDLAAATPYSLSVWVSLGTSNQAVVILRNNNGGTESRVLATAAGTTIQSEQAGTLTDISQHQTGSVLQLTLTFTPNFSNDLNLGIGPASPVPGETLDVLGAQLSEGSVASTYIPTFGASATRAADVVTWEMPDGVFDLRTTDGEGAVVDQTAIAISGSWEMPLPFKCSSLALYPAGTL